MISYERLCEALDHFNSQRRGEGLTQSITPGDVEAPLSPDDLGAVVSEDASDLVIDDSPDAVVAMSASPEEPPVDPAATDDQAGRAVALDPAYQPDPASYPQDPAPAAVPVDPAPGLEAQAGAAEADPAEVQEDPAFEPGDDGHASPVSAAPMESEATIVTAVPLEEPREPTP